MNWNKNTSYLSPTQKKTSNVEFPSARQVPIEWDKLASVDLHDLNNGECTVEILQEHLNHVAFCCSEREFKLDTLTGQRNMHKIFRLAQLIIQYLFLSQEYMETEMKKNTSGDLVIAAKYKQIKADFQRQIDEAKKLKKSNKNMKETIIYLNSLLTSMGALEHFRCPICPKAFRNQDYLRSHLQRKHPTEALTIDVSKCIVYTASSDSKGGTTPAPATGNATVKRQKTISWQPSSLVEEDNKEESKSYGEFFEELTNNQDVEEAPATKGSKQQSANRNNDIDSFTLKEMQKKFDVMNNLIIKLSRNVEWQNKELLMEKETRDLEIIKMSRQKDDVHHEYERALKELNEKLIAFQSKNEEAIPNKNMQEIIERQSHEIENLSSLVQSQTKEITLLKNSENETLLKNEILKLSSELKKMSKSSSHVTPEPTSNDTIRREEYFYKEIENLKDQLKSQSRHNRKKYKLEQVNSSGKHSTNFTIKQQKNIPNPNAKPNFEAEFKQNHISNTCSSENDPIENESEISSIHDTSNASNFRRTENKEFNNISNAKQQFERHNSKSKNKSKIIRNNHNRSTGTLNVYQTTETSDSNKSELEESDEELKRYGAKVSRDLRVLLDNNPGAWRQMREVVEKEMERKLNETLGEDLSSRIGTKEFEQLRKKFRSNRQYLNDKFENFYKLRKIIEKETHFKSLNKLLSIDTSSKVESATNVPCFTYKNKLKKLQTKMKRKSGAFKNAFQQRNENQQTKTKQAETFISGEEMESQASSNRVDNDESKSITDVTEDDSEKRTEMNAPTERSTSSSSDRSGTPLRASPVPEPKMQSFFENKTYGSSMQPPDSESESDSENEYEKVKPEPAMEYESLESLSRITEERESISEIPMKVTMSDSNIRLKKPTGSNVIELTKVIERKMLVRSQEKPAGSIDIFGSSSSNPINQDSIRPTVIIEDLRDIESESD